MATALAVSANDRFKTHFINWFWEGVALAAVLHFLAFALWPQMQAADISSIEQALVNLGELPPEIEIPPPPQAIARPATPVVSDAVISEDITIASTTFEDNPVSSLPPPPPAAATGQTREELMRAPTFVPMTVRPEVKNRTAVQAALERTYPPMLRDAGIGGRPVVWFFIDEDAQVLRTRLSKSSGYDALDQAALEVADIMEFSPAYNRDRKVPVWVEIAIDFSAK
jgi:protein TonB